MYVGNHHTVNQQTCPVYVPAHAVCVTDIVFTEYETCTVQSQSETDCGKFHIKNSCKFVPHKLYTSSTVTLSHVHGLISVRGSVSETLHQFGWSAAE